ncbi:hypothetical protein EON65_08500 [archaeon]|nr:MAG: hypothetical protein EON65_08500 [archaeon]
MAADILTLTTPLTMYTPNTSHTPPSSHTHTHVLTEQYGVYVQGVELSRWVYVMGVVGVAGERNRGVCREMVRGMYR